MKIYAIGWQKDQLGHEIEKMRYFIYTSKFFEEREEINQDFYEELKKTFTLSNKMNNSRSGMYFNGKEI